MRRLIRELLAKPRTNFRVRDRAPQHRRKRCLLANCSVCADIDRRHPPYPGYVAPDCSCGTCNFCRETEKFERIFDAHFGAEMDYYYDVPVNRANTFKAVERAYYYCLSLD